MIGDTNVRAMPVAAGTQISTLAVGTLVKINENGAPVEYMIVNQGLPSSMYDASCDGCWVLRNNLLPYHDWDYSNNEYGSSSIDRWLQESFFPTLDNEIRNLVKQVKIPYIDGVGDDGIVASGANGLSRKVFLLSLLETGGSGNVYVDGAKLSYFEYGETSSANAKRQATLDGNLRFWWTRTASYADDKYINVVNGSGNFVLDLYDEEYIAVRPTLILPSSALVDDELNVLAA